MSIDFKRYAPAIARIGISIVFLIFGIWQIIHPESWFGYLPNFVSNLGFNLNTVVLLNGFLDTFIGIGLIVGIFVRFFSLIAIVHLIGIILSLGWNDVAVRDIGLLIVLISIFFNGKDKLCITR